MTGKAGGPAPDQQFDVREIFDWLARAGRFRDEETAEHVERVSRTCELIALQLDWSPDDAADLRLASALHDIGKIGIPDSVLLKPGPLTPAERAVMERHPQIGHQILRGSDDPVMELAATIALVHHERVDGTGYPAGAAGDDIPLAGRICAVADVFDALTHARVYRGAMPVDRALEIIRAGRGREFDPAILDAFEACLPEVLKVQEEFADPQGLRIRGA